MVTFTSYGRADQLQIFRLLRLNCKLLIMSSDAVVFSANENLGNALVPPWFLVHEGPCAAPCMQSPRTFDPVWTWLTPQAPVWKNASPTPLGGFQILKSELSAHSRAFVLLYWMGIYLLKWNGKYLGIYILFIRLKEGEKYPKSYITLFHFIWGKMFYARPSESKTQSYDSTHRRPPSFLHQQWWKDANLQANRKRKRSPTLGMCLRSWFMFHAESYSCSSS